MLLPSGKMEQPLFFSKVGGCYCHVAGWKSHICTEFGRCYCQVADVIATVYLCDGRYNSQVADGITTQSGWCCLVDVITKLQIELP